MFSDAVVVLVLSVPKTGSLSVTTVSVKLLVVNFFFASVPSCEFSLLALPP